MNVNSFRFADQVSIGDEVLAQEMNQLVPNKVIDIAGLIMESIYYISVSMLYI